MSKNINETKPSNNEIREDILKLLNENTSEDTNLLSKLKEYLCKHDSEFLKKEENTSAQGINLETESNIETSVDNDKQNKEKKKTPIFKNEKYNNDNSNKENNLLKRKRKNNNKDDLSDNSNENNSNNLPSFLKLNELVKKYGLTNVLRTLYKPNLDLSKSLDKSLQKIIDSQGSQKLTFMLLNIHCTNNKCENNDSNSNINLEEEDTNTSKENKKDNNHSLSQPAPNKIFTSKKQNDDNSINNNDNNNVKNEDDNDEVKIDLEEKTQDNNQKGNINNNNSSRFRKELGLGVHFHKDDKDNIYKYCLHHFLGETRAIFYCSDKQCKSIAKYDVDTKVFTITVEHSKTHAQHNYILNFESEKKDKIIFLDFQKKNYKEGQVFRKGEGKRIVQWYNC